MEETKKAKVKQYFKDLGWLLLIFLKIGLFSFGGGYGMLSMFQTELVEKKKWLTQNEFADIIAIAEATPGPIAINVATYVGNLRCGILGGLVATLGVVLPSFAIIIGISYIVDLVKENFWVAALFKGIRIGVLVLILKAFVTFCKNMRKDLYGFLLCIAAFAIAFLTNVSVIYIILATILLSTLGYVFARIYVNKKYHAKGTQPYEREVKETENEEVDS